MTKFYNDCTLSELRDRGIGFRGPPQPPRINDNHIDGPVIFFSDGQMHWLSLWERFQRRYRGLTAMKLQEKLRPRLSAELKEIWKC